MTKAKANFPVHHALYYIFLTSTAQPQPGTSLYYTMFYGGLARHQAPQLGKRQLKRAERESGKESLGFSVSTRFRVERSDDRKYVCVRSLPSPPPPCGALSQVNALGGREHTTTNSPLIFLTWIKSLRIKLQKKIAHI